MKRRIVAGVVFAAWTVLSAAPPAEPKEAARGFSIQGPPGLTSAIAIDFSVVNAQSQLVYCGLGSTTLAFRDPGANMVEMTIGGEIEMGEKQKVVYRVPRSVGNQTFTNTSTGPDFSAIEKYRRK